MEKWEEEIEELLKAKKIELEEETDNLIGNFGKALIIACLLSIGAKDMTEQQVEERKELISKLISNLFNS